MVAIVPKTLMIGTPEIILICLVAFLIFGGKKLPELMKGMGEGVRSFRDALSGKTSKEEGANLNDNQPDSKDNTSLHNND